MPLVLADRVKDTTTTTGTGTVTLSGTPPTGFQAFSVIGNGNTTYYTIVGGSQWEVGLGTYSSTGPTLARTTVLESSNSNTLVNFSAGTKEVFVTYPADKSIADGFGTLAVANGGTGATTLTANNVILGNGTTAVQFVAPGTSGNVLTSNGTTWTSAAAGASLTGVTQSATPFETSLGFEAGLNTTGINNTFVGYQAGKANTTGAANTAVGYQALDANTTGPRNTALGVNALGANTTGRDNVAIGNTAALAVTTANDIIAIGSGALAAYTTGGSNIAIGNESMRSLNNSSAQANAALGHNSMYSATTAERSTAIGHFTAYSTTTGSRNTSVGRAALYKNTTGQDNTTIGHDAGSDSTTGAQNTLIGSNAGFSGTNNLTTGNNNIIIGYNAAASSATVSNEVTIGNSSIATIRAQVTTITSLSDARDKTDVADLDAGLSFLNALRPVRFTWAMRDGGKVGQADTGFIAQDLQAAMVGTGIDLPGLVYDVNPDKLEAGYGKLLPVLVKAIQELSAKVEALEAQLKGA